MDEIKSALFDRAVEILCADGGDRKAVTADLARMLDVTGLWWKLFSDNPPYSQKEARRNLQSLRTSGKRFAEAIELFRNEGLANCMFSCSDIRNDSRLKLEGQEDSPRLLSEEALSSLEALVGAYLGHVDQWRTRFTDKPPSCQKEAPRILQRFRTSGKRFVEAIELFRNKGVRKYIISRSDIWFDSGPKLEGQENSPTLFSDEALSSLEAIVRAYLGHVEQALDSGEFPLERSRGRPREAAHDTLVGFCHRLFEKYRPGTASTAENNAFREFVTRVNEIISGDEKDLERAVRFVLARKPTQGWPR